MKALIQADLKTAMKAGDKQRTGVLRMVLAEVMNAETAGKPVEEAVAAYGKRLEKSIVEYRALNRSAEVETFQAELAIVDDYLPKRMSEAEMDDLVARTIAEEQITSAKDMGRAMKKIMADHGKQVDGRKIQELLKKRLGA